MILTAAAVLSLAASCQSTVAPVTIAQMAQHESSLNTVAVNINKDGSRDLGLMQINERNFAYLGLKDPFDPCQSIAAAARLMKSFSLYNTGSPTKGITNGYALSVQTVRFEASGIRAPPAAPSPTAPVNVFLRPKPARELVFISSDTKR